MNSPRWTKGIILALIATPLIAQTPTQTPPPAAGTPAAAPANGRAGGAGNGRGGNAVVDTRPMGTKPADLVIHTSDPVIQKIWDEGMKHSMVDKLMQTLSDSIGPRLTGTPGHKAGNNWLVHMYQSWGISAENQQFATWDEWERGPSHIDMVAPRNRTLEATILGWSPGTNGKTVTADVITLPDSIADSTSFQKWLPNVKGKFVALDYPQPTCRPNSAYSLLTTPEMWQVFNADRTAAQAAYRANRARSKLAHGGISGTRAMQQAMEKAGAAGVLMNYWSNDYGVDKIFDATGLKTMPAMDVSCEDYGLLWRLAHNHQGPKIAVNAVSNDHGEKPVFNTVARMPGTTKPNEYVMLSSHFDSWDGSSGSTDNGTGTITMLEAMRLLKIAYPQPKRTILSGHWGAEEEGEDGSGGYAADHVDVVGGLQALFNQDNGTGRITSARGNGLAETQKFLDRWTAIIPEEARRFTTFSGPGTNGAGSSDHASFNCYHKEGVWGSAFSLGSSGFDYSNITWHTNRDTYDKVSLQELQYNAVLTAMLAYTAANDDQTISHALAPGVNPRKCAEPHRTFADYLKSRP